MLLSRASHAASSNCLNAACRQALSSAQSRTGYAFGYTSGYVYASSVYTAYVIWETPCERFKLGVYDIRQAPEAVVQRAALDWIVKSEIQGEFVMLALSRNSG